MAKLAHSRRQTSANLDGFRIEYIESAMRADIVLDRAPFNAITTLQHDQLRMAFEALDDDPEVRIIVLRAHGEHFSSGYDIPGTPDKAPLPGSGIAACVNAPSRCSKPVIAANRGYCFGIGFELALACDFRIATETTLYAMPSQKIGKGPGAGVSARLLRTVGLGRAKDIIMRSRYVRGPQAYEWGIATEFVVDSELESATDALVSELLAFSPLSQRNAKKLLNDLDDAPPEIALPRDERLLPRLPCANDPAERVPDFHTLTGHVLQR